MTEHNFEGRDIVSINDFSREELEHVLKTAKSMEALTRKEGHTFLEGYVMAALFFEPSTRTRMSFESSMNKLGGKVINVTDAKVSSAVKGETLYDTIKMVESYSDVIVMRHNKDGAARFAAEATGKPVINAGDGKNQHPTQTMLDMYSIQKTQGKLDGLTIAMVGDLKYGRTVHSLATAMSHYNTKFRFVSPSFLQMPDYSIKELEEKGLDYSLHKDMNEVIKDVDVLYMTRVQKERFSDASEYEKAKDMYILTGNMLEGAKGNMKVMHPLPRVNEIQPSVDQTAYHYYFDQAANGVPIRQALLALTLGVMR